jgi:hypothetical protein
MESTYEAPAPDSGSRAVNTVDTVDLAKWKLLFTGEVLAISYVKAGGSRNNYLQCQDFSSYWQSAQLYWGTGNNSQNSYKKLIMMGGVQVRAGASKVTGGGALANLLAAKPTSNPTLGGVLGGIVSLLEAATGVYQKDPKKQSYRGVNDFLTQAEVRLHLTRTLGAHPDDDTSATFLSFGDLRSYFRRLTAATQSTASFMDLIQTFLGKIHHQWASVPAPPFIAEGTVKVRQLFPATAKLGFGSELDAAYSELAAARREVEERLQYTQARLDSRGGTPGPTVDAAVIDPAEAGKGSSAPATAEHASFSSVKAISNLAGNAKEKKDKYAALSLKVAKDTKAKTPQASVTGITTSLGKAVQAVELVREIAAKTPDGYLGHTTDNLRKAGTLLTEALGGLRRSAGLPMVTREFTAAADSRLNMFLFTPDLFMVPPPRCNVLFPDQYLSVNFGRAWMSEITRLWMFGQTSAGSETSVGYFSPNVSILNGPKAKDAAAAAGAGLSFLMDHEVFSGPIPALESVGDMNVFKKIHQQNLNSTKGKGDKNPPDPTGALFSGQARYSPQEHLQRAANYLFFAKRHEGRTMSVEARFSPHLIVGLPMLLLDPVEGSRDLQATGEPGTHYVGTIAAIAHHINAQGGASTQIQLMKCRAHNEGVDIFDPKNREGIERVEGYEKKITTVKKRKRIIGTAAAGAGDQLVDKFGDAKTLSPQWIANASGVAPNRYSKDGELLTDVYESRVYDSEDGKQYRVSTTERGTRKVRIIVKEVPYAANEDPNKSDVTSGIFADKKLGIFKTFFEIGDAPVLSNQAVGETDPAKRSFTKYEVSTEVTTRDTKAKALSFTFEATATPPWFANIYLSYNIGAEFYRPMLGCGSVLDEAILSVREQEKVTQPTDPATTYSMRLPAADGTTLVDVPIPRELTYPALSTLSAAEQLSRTWLGLRENNANLPLFIESYTARKYATLLDIMGNSASSALRPKNGFIDVYARDQAGYVEGFHENAFGNHGPMLDLHGDPLIQEPLVKSIARGGWKPPTKREVSPMADPRAERYLRISQYVAEISKLRSSLSGK